MKKAKIDVKSSLMNFLFDLFSISFVLLRTNRKVERTQTKKITEISSNELGNMKFNTDNNVMLSDVRDGICEHTESTFADTLFDL